MKTTMKIILPIIFCVSIFDCYLTAVAMGAEDTGLAKFILDKMIENRNKIENFKCINEQLISYSTGALKDIYELHLKKGPPNEEAQKLLDNTCSYQIDLLALDNKGSGRVEKICEEADAKGNRTGNRIRKITTTWDGGNSIDYHETSKRNSAAIGVTKQPIELTKRYAQPWTVFGGNFCNNLKRALEQNEKISIEKQKDGNYRIEILRPQNRKIIGVIAPNQGYSVILRERYLEGKLYERDKARFEQVKPGIWFPVSGEYSTGITTGTGVRATMTIKEIKINDPNFYDGLYHVDFAEGTYVSDIATGLSYVVGEPMSVTTGGTGKSLGEVAMDALEEMAKETNQKHQEAELFIPKVSIALKKDESFVLGFSDGKLVNPRNKPESEESNKFLTELGKGDIAWDGTVVATRAAKVLTTKQESNRPLKLTKGKWAGSYKLPEKVELPYSMLIVTREGGNYLMTIRKIEPNGIRVTYKKLNPQEVSHYKQKPKDG